MLISKENFESDYYLIAEGMYQIFSGRLNCDVEKNALKLVQDAIKHRDDFFECVKWEEDYMEFSAAITAFNKPLPIFNKPYPTNFRTLPTFNKSFGCGSAFISVDTKIVGKTHSMNYYFPPTSNEFQFEVSLVAGFTSKGYGKYKNTDTNPLEILLSENNKAPFNLDLVGLPTVLSQKAKSKKQLWILNLEKYLDERKKNMSDSDGNSVNGSQQSL